MALYPNSMTDFNSDGPTPQAKTEQILAITPILRGQKPRQQFNIPPKHQQEPQPQPQQPQQQLQQPPQQPPQAMGNDLIDFGQGAPQQQLPPQQRIPQQQHHQQELQRQQSMDQDVAPAGLQQPLEPAMGQPMHRVDTATDELDEFVDAEDGR